MRVRTQCGHLQFFFLTNITEGDVNLLASDEFWDPHAISGLLKSFLRELPASLLTRELHFRFLGIMGTIVSMPITVRLGLIR